MDPTHKRTETWQPAPFRDMEGVSDFLNLLGRLVRESRSNGAGIETLLNIRYEDRAYNANDLDEFARAAPDLVFEGLDSAGFEVGWLGKEVGARLHLSLRHIEFATLEVQGRKVTAVEGVMATAARALDQRAEQLAEEQAREAAVAEASAEADRGPAEINQGSGDNRLQRFLGHPYSVQIIGGVIAGVVVLVVAALVFS